MTSFGEIKGVEIRPLRQLCDERGKIMHMLRSDAEYFQGFGELYFSLVYPGVITGWHLHKRMVLNYAVPAGRIKLVCYDDRKDSPSFGKIQEIFAGEDCYQLITVPFGVWNGFKGLGVTPSIVANCATLPHDPEEIV
ncbi:MAG: dTDP-4-dehydrorhamnose 3,5-epimerase family protein, partial [Candidatus Omnitrophica bacterium]|nr:dTDP-4-dehydrorhamnose 3,5-epimerase family protein [Candidatus Omnitrophota bacterium]